MKKVLAFVLALVMVLSLAACGGSKVVGTWKSEDALFSTITFNSNGTGSMTMKVLNTTTEFDYTEKDGKLELSENGKVEFTYEYSVDGDNLTLKDTDSGSTYTYTK